MSIHEPPSSYMLRKISEVTVPDHVSWFPQTIGWQILACILMAFISYKTVLWGKEWWENRYRREALSLVLSMQKSSFSTESQNSQITLDLFEVMKAVVTYLNPKKANAFGHAFLIELDDFLPQEQAEFTNEIGQHWMRALVQKRHALSTQELKQLFVMSERWLREHDRIIQKEKGDNHAV